MKTCKMQSLGSALDEQAYLSCFEMSKYIHWLIEQFEPKLCSIKRYSYYLYNFIPSLFYKTHLTSTNNYSILFSLLILAYIA